MMITSPMQDLYSKIISSMDIIFVSCELIESVLKDTKEYEYINVISTKKIKKIVFKFLFAKLYSQDVSPVAALTDILLQG